MSHQPKLMVFSIDGMPFGLAEDFMARGIMPNLKRLAGTGIAMPMASVQPTVSCVAWASYATGKNPGKHGIYGFIDRREGSYDLSFPNAATLTAENIWTILSKQGKTVFGMNVPATYPPRPVNGIVIGGFLAPSLEKVAYPPTVGQYLKQIDYQIDSDAALARQDKKAMLGNLDKTLDKRAEAMFHFLDEQDWDFFHTHIMTSDRICHFLMKQYAEGDAFFKPAFETFFGRIDAVLGKLLDRLDDSVPLMVISDHGFCPMQYEVQLSAYLVQKGWTTPAQQMQHPLSIEPSTSKAYCMIPGRIYVNLAGREPGGIVPVADYQATRLAIKDDLLALKDPTGNAVIKEVVMREDLYWPDSKDAKLTPEQTATAGGSFGKAADLVAIPYDGYDLKLGLAGKEVFTQTALEGMHTSHDATLIARGMDGHLDTESPSIATLAPAILKRLDAQVPTDMDLKP